MHSDLQILSQVESLVADCLQVVSYKWLSRKFSIPANRAKRLLQHFADENGKNIQVVYAVSGWTDPEQRNYSVQLVSRSKLEDAKKSLVGSASCHVYSLQPSLPKDPAELWSTDFVQATELFNEPSEMNNCLRDNRLSAVTCACITRTMNGKDPRIVAAAPLPAASIQATKSVRAEKTHAESQVKEVAREPVVGGTAAIGLLEKGVASEHDRNPDSAAEGKASIAKPPNSHSKPTLAIGGQGKLKTTGAAGQGSSLANLWGRAKPKQIIKDEEEIKVVPQQTSAGNAEQATEIAGGSSSDDDAKDFARLRRGHIKRRPRHVIMQDDSSDGEEGPESTVSLSSPGAPSCGRESGDGASERDTLSVKVEEAGIPCRVEGAQAVLDSPPKGNQHSEMGGCQGASPKEGTGATHNARGFELEEASSADVKMEPEEKTAKSVDDSSAPKADTKKRRLVKKTIDERGREVYEATSEQPVKKPAILATKQAPAENRSIPPNSRPEAPGGAAQQKVEAAASTSGQQQKSVTKVTGRNGGKAAVKGPQQGNLFTFFKRT